MKFFRRGLITNLLNPKAGVFYVSMLPKFIHPEQGATAQAVILTLTFVLVATLIHSFIVILAGEAQNFLENDEKRNKFQKIGAIILVIIAIWFAIST